MQTSPQARSRRMSPMSISRPATPKFTGDTYLAMSTSPDGSKSGFESPILQEMRFSDDFPTVRSNSGSGEIEQTPPLFMMPEIRRETSEKKHNVLIVTDFTFPKFGGVETHIY